MILVEQHKHINKLVALAKGPVKRSRARACVQQGTKKNPWLWILSGALAGVLISSSIFMRFNFTNQNVAPNQQIKNTKPIIQPAPKAVENKAPVFDFYTELPKMNASTPMAIKSIIPATPPTTVPSSATQVTAPTTPKEKLKPTTTEKPMVKPIEAVKISSKYIVQVSMFNKMDAADELKAELTLAGFDAHIEPMQKNNVTWYRIILGPFNSEQLAVTQQNLLKQQNIRSGLIRLEQ